MVRPRRGRLGAAPPRIFIREEVFTQTKKSAPIGDRKKKGVLFEIKS